MKFNRFLAAMSVLICAMLLAGCGYAAAVPAFTINMEDLPGEPPAPARVAPAGRVVLAEVFTYDEWPFCPPALQAIKKLSDELGPENLVVLEYHTKDTWSSKDTEALYKYYKPEGTPTIYFDGANGVSGGGDTDYLYARYKRTIMREAAVAPVVVLSAAKLQENITGTVSVKLMNVSGDLLEGAWLYGVAYQDLGTERHHFMVSAISKKSVPQILNGQAFETELNFDTQASLLNVIVFLKSASGPILQAVLVPGTAQLWLPWVARGQIRNI